MSFCTVVNCMDGRTQLPVNDYLRRRFDVKYVDTITEPGPVAILGTVGGHPAAESILRRTDISVKKHHSQGLAVVGHWDCAGNPAPEETQRQQAQAAMALLRGRYPSLPVIGLWVDEQWRIHELV